MIQKVKINENIKGDYMTPVHIKNTDPLLNDADSPSMTAFQCTIDLTQRLN